jgi:hypothetical protein
MPLMAAFFRRLILESPKITHNVKERIKHLAIFIFIGIFAWVEGVVVVTIWKKMRRKTRKYRCSISIFKGFPNMMREGAMLRWRATTMVRVPLNKIVDEKASVRDADANAAETNGSTEHVITMMTVYYRDSK